MTRLRPGQLPPISHAVALVIAAWAVLFELVRLVSQAVAHPTNNDYRVFYLAARAGIVWGWSHIYDPGRLEQLNTPFEAAGTNDISPLYTYMSPPLVAWLVALLTPLPLVVGWGVWAAFNIGAFGAASRLMFGQSRTVWLAVFLGSLAVWPSALSLERGQPDLLLYSLVIASWWCASRERHRLAGVLLGLAGCVKPQEVALLPAVFLLCGLGRTVLWWLATTAAAVAVFAVTLGPTGIGTYLGVTAWALSDPYFTVSPLVSVFGARASVAVGQTLIAAVALVGVWVNRRTLRVALAIGIVGTLASAIHLHEYDYVGLVVAAWLAADRTKSAYGLAWLAAGLVCVQLTAIGVMTPIVVWIPMWLVYLALPERWLTAARRVAESVVPVRVLRPESVPVDLAPPAAITRNSSRPLRPASRQGEIENSGPRRRSR